MNVLNRSLLALALLAAAILWAGEDLRAGEVKRKVGQGESISLICGEVYGEKGLYEVVALYNGKTDPTMVRPGEVLRLPWSDTVTLRKGESLSSLAKRVWGDAKMYPVLAWANGIEDPARVPAGTRLKVPVLVPYRLKRGESVSAAAGRFYGDPKQYGPIVTASGLEDPGKVPAGASLRVPYLLPAPVVKKAAAPRPAPRPAPPQKPPVPPPDTRLLKALDRLARGEAAFRKGDYGDGWTLGHEAAGDLEGKDRARAYRLTAAAQHAFGKPEAALEDLVKAHELEPDFKPDPAYVNPEMMELYKKAGTPLD